MNRFITAFLIALLAWPVNAESAKGSSSIEEMFSVMGIDNQLNGGFEALLPVVDQLANRFQLNIEAKEELKNIYRDWFENDIDRVVLKTKMMEIYSETFNENEITALIAFYKSPIGVKVTKKTPALMKLGAEMGMQEAQSKQHLLLEKLKPFLDKHKK